MRAAALGLMTMLAALPVGAAEIVPHRAVYKMTLERASNAAGVDAVTGVLLYEWARQCDGWTVEQRYRLTMRYSDDDQESDLSEQFVTWESLDGRRYRYSVRKQVDGETTEDIRGSATIDPGQEGSARFTRPSDTTITLPKGTLFPSAHTLALLRAAIAGTSFLRFDVFDGSAIEGPFEATAGIGRAQTPDPAATNPLLRTRWWPIRMAFFPTGDTSGTPDYEIGLDLAENGVSRSMLIDYGSFAIRGTLEQVERLPEPQC